MHEEIIVVSGLPRSGTSLMMQMLDRGGIEIMTDNLRTADIDNPKGYYEFEDVKKVKQNADWLPSARGKALKAVSQLLYDLPPSERYRVIFMRRDLDEMLRSQEKMLLRLDRTPAPADKMKQAYELHLERLFAWLEKQSHLTTMFVNYGELMATPEPIATEVNQFLNGRANIAEMMACVDPALYRNRT